MSMSGSGHSIGLLTGRGWNFNNLDWTDVPVVINVYDNSETRKKVSFQVHC